MKEDPDYQLVGDIFLPSASHTALTENLPPIGLRVSAALFYGLRPDAVLLEISMFSSQSFGDAWAFHLSKEEAIALAQLLLHAGQQRAEAE